MSTLLAMKSRACTNVAYSPLLPMSFVLLWSMCSSGDRGQHPGVGVLAAHACPAVHCHARSKPLRRASWRAPGEGKSSSGRRKKASQAEIAPCFTHDSPTPLIYLLYSTLRRLHRLMCRCGGSSPRRSEMHTQAASPVLFSPVVVSLSKHL